MSREEDLTHDGDRQPRERAVKCRRCFNAFTWSVDAICLRCRLEDAELIP